MVEPQVQAPDAGDQGIAGRPGGHRLGVERAFVQPVVCRARVAGRARRAPGLTTPAKVPPAPRGRPAPGHIATNHSLWALESVRLPVETLLLIYADFRVKEAPGPDGGCGMRIISLHESFKTIRDKLPLFIGVVVGHGG